MAQGQVAAPANDPVVDTLVPALRFGAVCGVGGFLFGGTSGILRGAPPFLFASASALQTFALGTVFSGTRHGIIKAWTTPERPVSRRDLTKASAISGGISGGVIGLLTRGRSNAIPGLIMFSLFGAVGQHVSNRWTAPTPAPVSSDVPKPSFWMRMSQKGWSPVRIMSNEEYAQMLHGKLLRADAEIAVLDDKITALREQLKREEATANDQAPSQN